MKPICLLLLLACSLAGCTQQSSSKNNKPDYKTHIGGTCEGCEAIYECPVAFEQLTSVDTLPDFNDQNGPRLEISGIVYQSDGKTPAQDVVLYVYHTNHAGVYPTKGDEKGWAKRHGYIRGWVKTDEKGYYKFYTQLPASYPNSKAPKHIHATVKENDKNEYWIDEYLFEGDPHLEFERPNHPPRGGNGIVTTVMKDRMLRATRDIVLGLNVPDYPVVRN